mmetsp:Transcript_6693/g.9362  ORF Transcript_6693/g.9362 Transcript_6693/m.9362 type:complete len:491 (+) Transcript_6693:31-1503(+)
MEGEEDCFVPLAKNDNEQVFIQGQLSSRTRRYGPWQMQDDALIEKNCLIRLHDEILGFCDLVTMTAEEKSARAEAIADTKEAVKEAFGSSAKVAVFGSEMTGLTLPSSDIDVVVFGATSESSSSKKKNHLRIFGNAIKAKARSVEIIANARIPLVKFTTKQYGVSIDVSFDVDSGLRTAELVRRFCDELPPLRPLTLVLKQFLAERDLNETYHGGIGSYALQMMITSFLQMRHRVDCASGLISPSNLGALLLEFFELYGRDLDSSKVGISVRNNGSYFNKHQRDWFYPSRPTLLAIENPDDPIMDVGKNSYQYFPRIRKAFDHAYSTLLAIMSKSQHSKSLLAAILDPDHPILARRALIPGAFSLASLSLPPISPISSPSKIISSGKRYLGNDHRHSPSYHQERKKKAPLSLALSSVKKHRRSEFDDHHHHQKRRPSYASTSGGGDRSDHYRHQSGDSISSSRQHSFSHPTHQDILHRSLDSSRKKPRRR